MITKTSKKIANKPSSLKPVITPYSKIYKKTGVIVSFVVLFIFGYIVCDFFIFNKNVEKKVLVVNKEIDSLKVYLNTKIPEIDKAIKTQEQQVKDLKDISTTYIKK